MHTKDPPRLSQQPLTDQPGHSDGYGLWIQAVVRNSTDAVKMRLLEY